MIYTKKKYKYLLLFNNKNILFFTYLSPPFKLKQEFVYYIVTSLKITQILSHSYSLITICQGNYFKFARLFNIHQVMRSLRATWVA